MRADPEGAVVGAIARELVDFDCRMKADQSTWRARWTERFIQNPVRVRSCWAVRYLRYRVGGFVQTNG